MVCEAETITWLFMKVHGQHATTGKEAFMEEGDIVVCGVDITLVQCCGEQGYKITVLQWYKTLRCAVFAIICVVYSKVKMFKRTNMFLFMSLIKKCSDNVLWNFCAVLWYWPLIFGGFGDPSMPSWSITSESICSHDPGLLQGQFQDCSQEGVHYYVNTKQWDSKEYKNDLQGGCTPLHWFRHCII